MINEKTQITIDDDLVEPVLATLTIGLEMIRVGTTPSGILLSISDQRFHEMLVILGTSMIGCRSSDEVINVLEDEALNKMHTNVNRIKDLIVQISRARINTKPEYEAYRNK